MDTKKNLTPFTKDRQPTSEQLKAGWERKRQAKRMMDKILEYMSMNQKEFMDLLNDIKQNPEKYTVEEVLLYKYATKAFNGEKFMLDWFDRNISKAPQNLANEDDKPLKLLIERVTLDDDQS